MVSAPPVRENDPESAPPKFPELLRVASAVSRRKIGECFVKACFGEWIARA